MRTTCVLLTSLLGPIYLAWLCRRGDIPYIEDPRIRAELEGWKINSLKKEGLQIEILPKAFAQHSEVTPVEYMKGESPIVVPLSRMALTIVFPTAVGSSRRYCYRRSLTSWGSIGCHQRFRSGWAA